MTLGLFLYSFRSIFRVYFYVRVYTSHKGDDSWIDGKRKKRMREWREKKTREDVSHDDYKNHSSVKPPKGQTISSWEGRERKWARIIYARVLVLIHIYVCSYGIRVNAIFALSIYTKCYILILICWFGHLKDIWNRLYLEVNP